MFRTTEHSHVGYRFPVISWVWESLHGFLTNRSTVEGDPIFLKKPYFFNFTENGSEIYGWWGTLVYVSICLPNSNCVLAVKYGNCEDKNLLAQKQVHHLLESLMVKIHFFQKVLKKWSKFQKKINLYFSTSRPKSGKFHFIFFNPSLSNPNNLFRRLRPKWLS